MRRREVFFPCTLEFYAGDLRVGVTSGRHVLVTLDLLVDPDIAKLTREEYAAMIADIARSTLALYRFGQVTIPTFTRPVGMRSDLVTLELVRANFEVFERALSRIADQPVRALRSTRVMTDTMRARRVDDAAIGGALAAGRWRPATAAEARSLPRLVGALGGRWISRLEEGKREDRVDVYENRALLGSIRRLDGLLARIARRLGACEENCDTAYMALWLARLERWRMRLAALANRQLFAGLVPETKLNASSVFRQHPDYAMAFSAIARMKSGVGTGISAAPAVPIDRTYALYEIWCYIGVLRAAAEAFPMCAGDVAELLKGCESPDHLGTALSQGDPTRLALTSNLTLTYQRRFRPVAANDGSRTLVIEAVPDMTLARTDAQARCTDIVVIDPKYRTGASLMDGIRDLHVYRDAIVGDGGQRLVMGAVALTPRPGSIKTAVDLLPTDAPVAFVACPARDPQPFGRLLDAAVRVFS